MLNHVNSISFHYLTSNNRNIVITMIMAIFLERLKQQYCKFIIFSWGLKFNCVFQTKACLQGLTFVVRSGCINFLCTQYMNDVQWYLFFVI